jgi:MFS transporter, DHA3 family, macrolide efflux protein
MIDVCTALLAVALLMLYRIPQPRRDPAQRTTIWSDVVEGVRLVMRHRGLRLLYLVVTLMVVLIMPIFSLAPLFVSTHFDGDVNQVAVMQGLGGVGLILGGVGLILGGALAFVLKVRRKIVMMLACYALSCALLALIALLGPAVDARQVYLIGGSLAALICLLGFTMPALIRMEDAAPPQPAVSSL